MRCIRAWRGDTGLLATVALLRTATALIGAFSIALMVACAAESSSSGAVPATTTPAATTAPVTATSRPLPAAVVIAVAQAAADAGVAPEEVTVLDYRNEDWSSAALGCPEPGKFYAQVVTPGYRVRLLVGGIEREYHTDTGRRAISCAGQQ